MSFNLESLVSFDRLLDSPEKVLDLVDSQGHIIILRNNKPMYIISRVDAPKELLKSSKYEASEKPKLTLHEAMQVVLKEVEGQQMHAADLADEIYRRELYRKKDGSKAEYNQIRARCGLYDMFEALPGNIIRLSAKTL